jgi:putative hydrolase of the HAD superfamily
MVQLAQEKGWQLLDQAPESEERTLALSKALIWDFDGTLAFRRGGMWSVALVEVAAQEAPELCVTAEQLQVHLGSGFPWHTPEYEHLELDSADAWWDAIDPVFERAFVAAGVAPDLARCTARKVRDVYPDAQRWRLFDDVILALEQLSGQGWTHAILSNHVPELGQIVARLGLGGHVAPVINSAETGYEKPHPQAFGIVLEALGGVTTVVMIGDSLAADIEGARAVGIPGTLVRNNCAAYEHNCSGLSGVPGILRQLGENSG